MQNFVEQIVLIIIFLFILIALGAGVFALFTIARAASKPPERLRQLLSPSDVLTTPAALTTFYEVVRTHGLTVKPVHEGEDAVKASNRQLSVTFSTRLSIYDSNNADLVLIIEAKNSAPNLTLSPLASVNKIAPRALTGDEAFDAAFALAPEPMGNSVAALGPDNRRALLACAQAPRVSALCLSEGALTMRVVQTSSQLTAEGCDYFIQRVSALAQQFTLPRDIPAKLMELARADTSAPLIQTQAYAALLAHPQVPSALLDRALSMALHDATTPAEMRVMAAERLGRAGTPIMYACLASSPSLALRARALDHLCAHLSDGDLRDLTEGAWSAWLSVARSAKYEAGQGLAAAAYRALARHPAPGRLPILVTYLSDYDQRTFEDLVRAIDAQPDPAEMLEQALLPLIERAPMQRLLLLLPTLSRRGGSPLIGALRGALGRASKASERSAIQSTIDAIHAKLPNHLAGSLSLTSDAQAGALSMTAPKEKTRDAR